MPLIDIEVEVADLRVRSRESIRREFKAGYETEKFAKYARTIAAMANTEGGMIVFGVSDRPRRLVGCREDEVPDEAKLTDKLQSWFDPCPNIEIVSEDLHGFHLIGIRVDESRSKPVICKKTVTIVSDAVLTEGAIYRRYSGKTQLIRSAELQEILSARDQRIIQSLLGGLTAIRRIGVDRVGFVDKTALAKPGATKMYVPRDALGSLNLIQKGRFTETEDEGDRAYLVVGEVEIGLAETIAVDDEDRLRPKEAVGLLKSAVQQALHQDVRLVPGHLACFAKARGYRPMSGNIGCNDNFCKFDAKSGMWFYRSAFVDEVRQSLAADPLKVAGHFQLGKAILASVRSRHEGAVAIAVTGSESGTSSTVPMQNGGGDIFA